MNDRQLVKRIKQIILENTGKDLISLYLVGSFVTKEMTKSSDIDIVGVMKPTFNFRKEKSINRMLNKDIDSKHRIDFGTMSYEEFFGGKKGGSLTKHIDLHVFMNFLKTARIICGERLDLDRFPVKPMPIRDELRYHIRVFNRYKNEFRKRDRVGPDFSFRDFIKIIFYITNLELQLMKKKPKIKCTDLTKAFGKEKDHIVHYSLRLRKKGTITSKEKYLWLNRAELYVKQMQRSGK